jgi:hypothetical protein
MSYKHGWRCPPHVVRLSQGFINEAPCHKIEVEVEMMMLGRMKVYVPRSFLTLPLDGG